jgi:hypothetical protein
MKWRRAGNLYRQPRGDCVHGYPQRRPGATLAQDTKADLPRLRADSTARDHLLCPPFSDQGGFTPDSEDHGWMGYCVSFAGFFGLDFVGGSKFSLAREREEASGLWEARSVK